MCIQSLLIINHSNLTFSSSFLNGYFSTVATCSGSPVCKHPGEGLFPWYSNTQRGNICLAASMLLLCCVFHAAWCNVAAGNISVRAGPYHSVKRHSSLLLLREPPDRSIFKCHPSTRFNIAAKNAIYPFTFIFTPAATTPGVSNVSGL